jgi:hypothetical protein
VAPELRSRRSPGELDQADLASAVGPVDRACGGGDGPRGGTPSSPVLVERSVNFVTN